MMFANMCCLLVEHLAFWLVNKEFNHLSLLGEGVDSELGLFCGASKVPRGQRWYPLSKDYSSPELQNKLKKQTFTKCSSGILYCDNSNLTITDKIKNDFFHFI